MSTPLRKVLPTECRPLLVGMAVYRDDDNAPTATSNLGVNWNSTTPQQQPRRISGQQPNRSPITTTAARQTPTTHFQQQQPNQNQNKNTTDWLVVARHTLLDVTRSLPVARNTEIRLKTTADAISKIELARQQADQPSLHHQQYKLPCTPNKNNNNSNDDNNNIQNSLRKTPTIETEAARRMRFDDDDGNDHEDNLSADFYSGGKDQSVYDEAVRVRNTLEIVATRIRDAIAQDVKNRIYHQQQDEHFRQKEKKLQHEQAEKIDSLCHEVGKLQTENSDLVQQLDNADRLRRSMLQNEKSQRENDIRIHVRNSQHASRLQKNLFLVENQELESRNEIQTDFLEELLLHVLRQHREFSSSFQKPLNDGDREQHDADTRKLLDQQRQIMHRESFEKRLQQIQESEQETRQLVESLSAAEFEFLFSFFAEETESVTHRVERHEMEINLSANRGTDSLEEEKKLWIQQRNHAISEIFQNHFSQDLENDFEPAARRLIESWESDQRESLFVSFFGSEKEKIRQNEEALKELEMKMFWTKYFQIWKCWTLKTREENLRLDQERHHRIVDSALFLQKSQLDTAMDSLVIHHFNNNNCDDGTTTASTSNFMQYYYSSNNNNNIKLQRNAEDDCDDGNEDSNNKSPSVWNHHRSNTSTGRSFDEPNNNFNLNHRHPFVSTSRRTTPNRHVFSRNVKTTSNNNNNKGSHFLSSSRGRHNNNNQNEGSVSP